jgi:hypothetical protein
MLRKAPDQVRLQRVGMLVDAVALLHQHALPEALAMARKLAGALGEADFDFDLACNLLSLLSLLANEDSRRDENADLVRQLGHRYCTSDATTALLLAAARAHEPYVGLIRECNETLQTVSEQAMKMHLQGDYRGAIDGFLSLADAYLNARLFEAANQLFLRHERELADAQNFREAIQSLRERAGVARSRPGFGDSQGRPPAGVMLRISAPLPEAMSSW